MKCQVWVNRSNKQLCITIPKNSGIAEGDLVTVEKATIATLVYTPVTGDMFHYGHLRVLQHAKGLGDLHVCGVLTNDAIKEYKTEPVAGLKERKAIIESLRCVDMVMTQYEMDPTENLNKLHEQFPNAQITLVYGSNWEKVPGKKYVERIGGKIVQPEFYEKLSSEKVLKKITKKKEE